MDRLASKFNSSMADFAAAATLWMEPWWWLSIAAIIFLSMIFGWWPLTTHPNHTQIEAAIVLIRKVLVLAFMLVIIAFPILVFAIEVGTSHNESIAAEIFMINLSDMIRVYWTLLLAAALAGWTSKFFLKRYLHTYLSSLIRKMRVVQTNDVQSDIRREVTRFEPLEFIPEKYYKKEQVFLGLDENRKPIHIPLETYQTTHMQIVGPTQTGKGVLLGVLLDQAIRRGEGVFYIDPKTDKFIPHIMAQACEAAGRPFIYLDLNTGGQGKWGPFQGGEYRDRRARLVGAYGLADRGTDADVYLARERAVVDKLLKNTNGTLKSMVNYISEQELWEKASRLADGLKEWADVDTFSPRKDRGFSIRRSLLEKAVVYIRGSIKDHVIRDATRTFIIELTQEISALGSRREGHLNIAVDEVRFVISEALVDALATVSSFGVNIITAYQSILDIRNLPDKTIDRQATEQSMNVNSQIKILYRAPDPETAEWGAKLSGTHWKTVPRFESTNIDGYGAETWGDNRMLNAVEEHLISENLLLGLQKRIAVVYQPGKLASICRTCWVPVKKEYEPKALVAKNVNEQKESVKKKQTKPVQSQEKKPAALEKKPKTEKGRGEGDRDKALTINDI